MFFAACNFGLKNIF